MYFPNNLLPEHRHIWRLQEVLISIAIDLGLFLHKAKNVRHCHII
jgi:hypothetical protein